MGLIAATLRVFTVILLFVPLRSCSISQVLDAGVADADGIGIAEGVGVGGTAIALQESGRPERVAAIQGDGVAVGIPLRHGHAGRGCYHSPASTEVESGPPPVWVIESNANELLFTVAVRTAFTADVNVSETTKLPLLSTLFAAKVRLAPVAVTVTFLTVVGVVLPCPSQGDEVEVGGARESDTDRRDRAAGGERFAAPVDRARGHHPHTRDDVRSPWSDRHRAIEVFRDGEVVVGSVPRDGKGGRWAWGRRPSRC